MNIYFVMQVNEYNNKSVNSVFVTKEGAEARCRELSHSQERCDNWYYVDTRALSGDEFAVLDKNSILRRFVELSEQARGLTKQLQTVSENLSKIAIEQPNECLFGFGTCSYPIEDCYNCPTHSWSDHTPSLYSCEFK